LLSIKLVVVDLIGMLGNSLWQLGSGSASTFAFGFAMTVCHRWILALALPVLAALAPPLAHANEPDESALQAEHLDVLLHKIEPHRLLLVGEIHGTRETPALIATLAQHMASSERLLMVGLEIPRDEQTRLQRFLDSAGTAEDRSQLLEGAFWQREYQDGRSSVAMLELIEALRSLALKTPIQVLAFDIKAEQQNDGAARDRLMAKRIRKALEAQPQARALILAGNFHTRIQDSAPWDPKHRFMGNHLIDLNPYSIEIMGITGSAWICTGPQVSDCKARDMPSNPMHAGLELGDEVNERGHHGKWWLPTSSASPPARGS